MIDYDFDVQEEEASGEAATASGGGRGTNKTKKGMGARAGRGRGGKRVQASSAATVCVVEECDEPTAKHCLLCNGHNRAWVALEFQTAAKQGPEAVAELKKLKEKGREVDRGSCLAEFCKLNTMDQKFKKKALFDTLGYCKKRFVKTSITDKKVDKAMTKAAFQAHCKYQLGLTEPECEAWWTEMYNDPRVERDLEGFRGREQLWIPASKERHRDRERGVEDAVSESSAGQKNYNPHDLKVLLDHADRQKTSMADKFIADGLPENRSLLKRAAPVPNTEGKAAGEEPQQKKRKKTFDADNDCAKYYQFIMTELEKIKVKAADAEAVFVKAEKLLVSIADEEKNKDPAMVGYIHKLQFRAQILKKFKGDDIAVLLFNNHASETDGLTSVPSLHLSGSAGDVQCPGTPSNAFSLSFDICVFKCALDICKCMCELSSSNTNKTRRHPVPLKVLHLLPLLLLLQVLSRMHRRAECVEKRNPRPVPVQSKATVMLSRLPRWLMPKLIPKVTLAKA